MPVSLRILLVIFSVLSMIFVIRRIKKSQVQLYDTTFWLFLAILFVIISIFPGIVIVLAELVGVQSPVNFLYLVIIFLLLAHCFIQSLRFSRLEAQFKSLVGKEALDDGKAQEKATSEKAFEDKAESDPTK